MKNIVEVSGLIKKYGDFTAVKNISFNVEPGTLFAFLGTNGAGKSTTINILTTLLAKNSGDVRVLNHELGREDDKIRQGIGVVFQNSVLDDLLTVKENLTMRGSLYNLGRSELEARIKMSASTPNVTLILIDLMENCRAVKKRRANIARAMLNRPQLLF